MILAVDLGNFNTKTSEGIIFPSRFAIDNTGTEPLEQDTITYNNNTYFIGKGSYDNTFNKSQKDYMPHLLFAIAKSVPEDVKIIKLVLGVPLANLGINDIFKDNLEGKAFLFKHNGKEREIVIEKVGTIGEGISSYYTLSEVDRNKDVLIIDIGGRTVNVVSYKNKKLDNKTTINKGMITDFYEKVKEAENFKGENFNTEIIKEYIEKRIIDEHEDIKEAFVKDLMNDIKLKFDVRAFNVFFTGGGALELQDSLDSILTMVNSYKIVQDPLFSNVNGNKKIAQIKWK